MDEKSAVERVGAAYEKLTAANARIKSLEKKLADGTLTMKEGAELTDLRAQAFGTAFSGKVLDIAQGERENACTELLRERCDDTDEVAEAAQRAALSRQGLNLTPPTAPFEEDRARKIGHSLEDPTVPDETIQRRAKSATETMIRSQYDRNMKQGAKTCAEAGLKTYIIRDSASGCCKWCDEVAGKFAYGSEPKDVYRRHDNCTCTVVYESGRGRQNVWSKQYWSQEHEREYLRLRDELKAQKRKAVPNVNEPVRLSAKEIQAIRERVLVLTFGKNGSIMPLTADHMGKPMVENVPGRSRVKVYKRDGYDNIWTQTNTANAQKSAAFLFDKLKNNIFGNVDRVIIAKHDTLGGVAAYDQSNNTLYWCEELADSKNFSQLVNSSYFAAKTVDDVLEHELGGHKRHWDRVNEIKNSSSNNYNDLASAKQVLEAELRDYVVRQFIADPLYIDKFVSNNAHIKFSETGELNELIADVYVKSKQGTLNDDELKRLVKELLGYDI